MREYILEIENLKYTYPDGTEALKGIDLKIEKNKKNVIVGVNGSGKSTLFLNLNGILKASEGKIYFKGKEIEYSRKYLKELRKSIGIVFQNPETMLFSSSVYQEVSFGVVNLDLNEEEIDKRVNEALDSVSMNDYKEKYIHFLSYGQKKRISIADILAMKPEVIIFDEPTSSLDPKHSKQLMTILNELSNNNITIILSTHDINFAYSWADNIIVLKDGMVEKIGLPEEVFSDNKLIEECYLEKPYILDFYEILKEKNIVKEDFKIPRTKEELYELIKL